MFRKQLKYPPVSVSWSKDATITWPLINQRLDLFSTMSSCLYACQRDSKSFPYITWRDGVEIF